MARKRQQFLFETRCLIIARLGSANPSLCRSERSSAPWCRPRQARPARSPCCRSQRSGRDRNPEVCLQPDRQREQELADLSI